MTYKIAVLPGDGIGAEITGEAIQLMETVADVFGHSFEMEKGQIGGRAVDDLGTPLPRETLRLAEQSDAVLLGAVGGPKWDHEPKERKPETGLLGIRKALQLYANLRPITVFPGLVEASTLKPEVVQGVDCLILRELTGGLYFGQPQERRETDKGWEVVDTLQYTEREMERIIRKGFELAQIRNKKLTSVDKANVLESSRMWRETAERISKDYPDVSLTHMLVDNAAMQLVRDPAQFDCIVTENMFGDILSDEASMITGSLGMLPSASLNESGSGLFEPVHGSAPDIAGENKANPLAMFSSVSMMLKYSFGLHEEAQAVDEAIVQVLEKGYKTADIVKGDEKPLSTQQMGEKVREEVRAWGK